MSRIRGMLRTKSDRVTADQKNRHPQTSKLSAEVVNNKEVKDITTRLTYLVHRVGEAAGALLEVGSTLR